jgi:hypothetical protein
MDKLDKPEKRRPRLRSAACAATAGVACDALIDQRKS